MGRKFLDRFIDLLSNEGFKRMFVYVFLFVVIVSPATAILYISYTKLNETLTESTFSQRQSIATLMATIVHERIKKTTDLATVLADSPELKEALQKKDNAKILEIAENYKKQFAYAYDVFVTSKNGIRVVTSTENQPNQSDIPFENTAPSTEPTLSPVYKKKSPPFFTVTALTVPIVSSTEHLGTLTTELRTDTFLRWAKSIDVGPGGFVYFVDEKGIVAAHPAILPQGGPLDLSSMELIQSVIHGKSGIGTSYSFTEQENQLVAYQPVPQYGWGVVIAQPLTQAFGIRNTLLRNASIVFILLAIFNALIIASLLHMVSTINRYRQTQKMTLESIGDGVIGIDINHKITVFNNAANTISGWSNKESLKKPFSAIFPLRPQDSEAPYALEAEILNPTNKFPIKKDVILTTKYNEHLIVAVNAAPILDTKNNIQGGIIILRDVTKEREAEKAKSEFVSLVSHQLRTPLSSIGWYTELLFGEESGTLTKQQKEYLGEVKDAHKSMLELVNALLNVSRIELGVVSINPEPVDIKAIAESVLGELAYMITGKKITVKKTFGANVPSINADAKFVRVVFQNLLSNALKYTPSKGTVKLEITKKSPNIVIKVTDTGFGIPKDQQPHIFQKFFRASNARTKEPDGNGLGLYIVKSIMDQTGGSISFVSKENKGTTFIATFPLSGMKKKKGTKQLS